MAYAPKNDMISASDENSVANHQDSNSTATMGSAGARPKEQQPIHSGPTTPSEEGHSHDRKRNFGHDSPPEDEGWEQQGKRSRRDGARSPMDTLGDSYNGPEVGQYIPLKIKFTGPSIENNLIYDSPTVQNLLQDSLFAGTYEGTGRKITSKHELILNITSIELIPELINITCLREGLKEWPIEVSVPINENECVFGVIKLHPSISDDRINEELNRNANANPSF